LKPCGSTLIATVSRSPSPRKAWIETANIDEIEYLLMVAFPPEGVD